MRLSIDLSHRAGSLALHRLGHVASNLVATTTIPGENHHSENLLDALGALLDESQVGKSDIRELVSSLGPGSFTGLRIAISTLKAFSMAWGLPMVLVNGSEARGRAFLRRNSNTQCNLVILAKIASKSYSRAVMSLDGVFRENTTAALEAIELSPGEMVLADSTETQALIRAQTTVFPLSAEYLGEQVEHCQFKIECRTFEDLARASPMYYGSSRF